MTLLSYLFLAGCWLCQAGDQIQIVCNSALGNRAFRIPILTGRSSVPPAVGTWELKGGDITITRFDGAGGEYSLLMGHGKVISGPATVGTYVWIEFNDWPQWEHKIIYGPYIHHCVGIYGEYAPALYEACRYIPGLKADPVDPDAAEIEKFLRA